MKECIRGGTTRRVRETRKKGGTPQEGCGCGGIPQEEGTPQKEETRNIIMMGRSLLERGGKREELFSKGMSSRESREEGKRGREQPPLH